MPLIPALSGCGQGQVNVSKFETSPVCTYEVPKPAKDTDPVSKNKTSAYFAITKKPNQDNLIDEADDIILPRLLETKLLNTEVIMWDTLHTKPH